MTEFPAREMRLDALRIVAALQVFVCHFAAIYAAVFLALDVDHNGLTATRDLLRNGLILAYFQFHGAYLFFAISGYVITRPWFVKRRLPSYSDYLARRAMRLLPAATTAVLVAAHYDFVQWQWRTPSLVEVLLNLTYLNWLAPAAHPPVLIVTWTLAVEWAFYFTAPALAALLIPYRASRYRVVLCVVIAITFAAVLRSSTANAYAYPLYFAIGMAFAGLPQGGVAGRSFSSVAAGGAALVAVASLTYAATSTVADRPVQWGLRPFDTFLLLHLAATVALLFWATRAAVVPSPTTRGLATFSPLTYSIYLWHFPVLSACTVAVATLPEVRSMGDAVRVPLVFAFSAAATLVVASLSYAIFERPYFAWRRTAGSL